MTILIFGRTGQIASELATLSPGALALSRAEADLANPDACGQAVRTIRPKMVLNAAAYTAVDHAEEEESRARLINAEAPAAMAGAAADMEIPFVHISTDYVFDGLGTAPHRPEDPVSPLSAYGRTKAEGERLIREIGGIATILRTSWVFSPYGSNFVKTMLRLGSEKEALSIVADQIGGPTPAVDIARTMLLVATNRMGGAPGVETHHISGNPDVSWASFADAIFTEAGFTCQITPIPTSDYPTPAKRPLNSRLDCTSLKAAYGVDRPDWRGHLKYIVREFSDA